MGAAEALICYECMETLWRSVDRPQLLYAALMGQWRYFLTTDKLTASMQLAQRVYSLAKEQDEPTLMVGACTALALPLYFMGDFGLGRVTKVEGQHKFRKT